MLYIVLVVFATIHYSNTLPFGEPAVLYVKLPDVMLPRLLLLLVHPWCWYNTCVTRGWVGLSTGEWRARTAGSVLASEVSGPRGRTVNGVFRFVLIERRFEGVRAPTDEVWEQCKNDKTEETSATQYRNGISITNISRCYNNSPCLIALFVAEISLSHYMFEWNCLKSKRPR